VIEVKRTTKSNEDTSSVDIPIAPALIKQAELLVSAHSDFLTTVETMMNEWLRRQRQAFDLSSRSVQKICGSRSIIDLAQAQGNGCRSACGGPPQKSERSATMLFP